MGANRWSAASAGIVVLCVASVAAGLDYQAVILHPASGYPQTDARGGISAGQQVGDGDLITGGRHALLWYGNSQSVVDLHPAGYSASAAWDVSAGQQVGTGWFPDFLSTSHALLWRGTPESVVDLHPKEYLFSEALGVGGSQQVGYVWEAAAQHAVLWQGTAESMVDLHPVGFVESVAQDTSGIHQVGQGWLDYFSNTHALLWSGTAESVVDLNPAGCGYSCAGGISGNQQVGFADNHAILWSGTADSAVDLHPSSCVASMAYGTNGSQQVGMGEVGQWIDDTPHALVWSGTADSVVDLHAFLPQGYEGSTAHDIDSQGRIIGAAYGPIGHHAVIWVPQGGDPECIPAPGAILLGMLGTGLVGWLRRRRTL